MTLKFKTLLIGCIAMGCAGTASAEKRAYPGADLMEPGTTTIGAPDYGPKAKKMAGQETPSPDTNGDGFVEASEVGNDPVWLKRIKSRDTNGDGKLSRDEYWFK